MPEIFRTTPQIIAASSIHYNIPIYQRLFEWDEEKICTLLSDLYAAYRNPVEPYYIGMLTANTNPLGELDLVDGQQRFTVTTLIGIIFKDYFPDWNNFLLIGDNPRLCFTARTEDYVFLKEIISNKVFLSNLLENVEINCYFNKRMRDGLITISKWMATIADNLTKADFAKFVYEQMSFFVTNLPSHYQASDLNRYFEAMNSLGRNLESHEILQVDCLMALPDSCNKDLYTQIWNLVSDMDSHLVRKINSRDKSKRETEDEYNSRFLHLISATKKADSLDELHSTLKRDDKNGLNDLADSNSESAETIGNIKADPNSKPSPRYHDGSHHSMLNFTEFLLQALYLHKGMPDDIVINDFFDVHKLSDTFKPVLKEWNENRNDCKLFFLNLLKYRLIYDYYVIQIANLDGDDYEIELRSTDDDNNSTNDVKVLKKFQSMLYAGSASKTFYRWIAPLLSYLDKENCENISANSIYQFLLGIDQKIRKSENLAIPIDSKSLRYDNGVPLYWFRRLDFILWKKIVIDNEFNFSSEIDTSVVDSLKFRRGGRSIEHLHPQNQDNNTKWDPSNIHEFGNLALVSSSFNSEQSNDNLDVKYGRIKQQIDSKQLQSIKLYLMYLSSNKDGAKWDEGIMEQHQSEMIDILNQDLKN